LFTVETRYIPTLRPLQPLNNVFAKCIYATTVRVESTLAKCSKCGRQAGYQKAICDSCAVVERAMTPEERDAATRRRSRRQTADAFRRLGGGSSAAASVGELP